MNTGPIDPQDGGVSFAPARELLLPATVLICFAVYYVAEQPFWVVVVCAAPVLALYALSPLWARDSLAHFDRDLVRLLPTRDPVALRARYRQALGMRLFSARAEVAERKAMVLAEAGDPAAARSAYAQALAEYGTAAPLRVLLGYAHVSFSLGDDHRAIELYERLLGTVGSLPGVERNLAIARARRAGEISEA
jgi:hypothetical protein